ncbi:hypothetical protein [Salinimicrobium flavum]|uniref:TonB protein C-terminal n=1 Tax=Salinimicrobium flavum TaxID=1737065 RepID=A0ABW5IUL5_9FLAO
MKTLKTVFVALAICLTTSMFADSNPVSKEVSTTSISQEIEKMLFDSQLVIEEEFKVTVIFQVTGDKRIEILSVNSPNQEVNTFIQRRLQNRKLHSECLSSDQIYALPINMQSLE